ncbi:hypothetical protein [Spongiimicrobium sp. 2-473A-2-J]|uniref:hypothetical protein n=1 Tax=Eudoraea algarum TaxID=3417568 RepID=UPI003D369A11
MRSIVTLAVLLLLSFPGLAQTDIPVTKPLKIEGKKLDTKDNKGTALNMPSTFDKKPEVNLKDRNKREVKMLPDTKLVQAGHGLKIDPKIGEKEKKGSDKHYGDQYLGDLKSNAKFVGIVCRDHEFVDGDRVKIYANGQVVEPNILLSGTFKGVNINLESGFNRLDFEALNQGSSGPNTAQVNVYDDKGQLIYANRWNLSTGAKASLIIVKE